MKALVVFESMFGNTQRIAEAIAGGLGSAVPVELVEVGAAPPATGDGVVLVVVGGPTHAFGLTRASTRADAGGQTRDALVSPGIGLREWFDRLGSPSGRVAGAAFDTRIATPRLPGSAAHKAHKRMRRLGFEMIAGPESFYVEDSKGPLVDGEIDRAREWGERLAAAVQVPAER